MDYAACTHPAATVAWQVVGVSGVDSAAVASVLCDWVGRGASWFRAIVACPCNLVGGVVGHAYCALDVGWCALSDVDCTWAPGELCCLPWVIERWSCGLHRLALDQFVWIRLARSTVL